MSDRDIENAMNKTPSKDTLSNIINASKGGSKELNNISKSIGRTNMNNNSDLSQFTTNTSNNPLMGSRLARNVGTSSLNQDLSRTAPGIGSIPMNQPNKGSGKLFGADTEDENDDFSNLLNQVPTRKSKETMNNFNSSFHNPTTARSNKPKANNGRYRNDDLGEELFGDEESFLGRDGSDMHRPQRPIGKNPTTNLNQNKGSKLDNLKKNSNRTFKSTKDAVIIGIVTVILIVFAWNGLVSAIHRATNPYYNDNDNPFIKTYRTFLGHGWGR